MRPGRFIVSQGGEENNAIVKEKRIAEAVV
jgi:hypothetical protein